ncbi:MAG: RidA family protein [Xanthomonadales bacterium]|nr:RidA family protein [Xanthomonadales bacterium]NIN74032.1 RidA family protein [Xanthomonadales bacterium]NIO12418.1 RidA family protein [Xanthomonadales bacterium]NIP11157.1 RidA family protein [Xanthomonadales bacterium]NIP18402.1 RidA family protein [Xanthomonadales bacterium]
MAEFRPTHAPAPVGAYPHARRVGDFLYLSGVGPRQADSNEIPGNRYEKDGTLHSYDIEAQTHAVLQNVRLILQQCGARWEDLVDITVFLTDMRRDFERFNRIYGQYFTSHQPCRTTVEVGALPTPIAIELKCIAYLEST